MRISDDCKTIIICGAILLVAGTGWVKNLIKLADCDFNAPYTAEVVHVVGLVPPVGMITGWLDLGK